MHTFKPTTVAQKVLELQYSTYYCYTCHKISILVVLIIEIYDLIPFAQNRSSIKASIHLSLFCAFFITPLHKNACNSFITYPIKLYQVLFVQHIILLQIV